MAGEAIRELLLRGLLPADIAKRVLKHLVQFAGNTSDLMQVRFRGPAGIGPDATPELGEHYGATLTALCRRNESLVAKTNCCNYAPLWSQ